MVRFGKILKEKAKDITAVPKKSQWEKTIPAMVRREISLTVDQISRLKKRHEEQFHRLLKLECYVGTELLQIEQHRPRYAVPPFPEQDKLKQRLIDIEKERRSLSLKLEEKTRGLEGKLLDLINKHEQLDI